MLALGAGVVVAGPAVASAPQCAGSWTVEPVAPVTAPDEYGALNAVSALDGARAWAAVAAPQLGHTNVLVVSARRGDDVSAVGAGTRAPIAEHWDGTRWNLVLARCAP